MPESLLVKLSNVDMAVIFAMAPICYHFAALCALDSTFFFDIMFNLVSLQSQVRTNNLGLKSCGILINDSVLNYLGITSHNLLIRRSTVFILASQKRARFLEEAVPRLFPFLVRRAADIK